MPLLVLIALAWCAGLLLGHYWLVPAGLAATPVALLGLLPLAGCVLGRREQALRRGSACVLVMLLGAVRYQLAIPNLSDPGFVAHYNGRGWLAVEGVVRGDPVERDTWTDVRLGAEWLEIAGQRLRVGGTVLVRAPLFPRIAYGDRLRVAGLLDPPPEIEGFSYPDWLARRGVYSVLNRSQVERIASGQGSVFWEAMYGLRDRAGQAIARLMPDPEASLLQGIVLGMRSSIPAPLYDEFNATSTSHILVISGANIVVVLALLSKTFGRLLGKRRATWLTLAGLALYVVLVGGDAPVVRAGVMGGLYVIARALGRRSTAYVSLAASATFLTLLSPQMLWDVGFQLSFVSVLGLVLFAEPIDRFVERLLNRAVPWLQTRKALAALKPVTDTLVVTLAAQILTIPLVVYTFGRLSLAGPVANLLIAPVQPLIMSWGGAATIVGIIPGLLPVARAVGWVPWLCLAYTTTVVRFLARWPWASVAVPAAAAGWPLLAGGALVASVWLVRRIRGSPGTRHNAQGWVARWGGLVLGVSGVLTVLVWAAVTQLPDGRLHVAFLDVGQGDAILITTPNGQQLLVDGGPSPGALTTALGREMPFWDHSLDLVVMSHADSDHTTGLAEVLRRYRVAAWLENGLPDDNAAFQACVDLLQKQGVPRYTAQAGERFALGQGLALEVLYPPSPEATGAASDANENSVVLRLTWNGVGFLLTGDIPARTEGILLQSGGTLHADVLKVAHHGSAGSSSGEFLSAVNPRFAIVSVGTDNLLGLPAPPALERLAQLGNVDVLRTDERGTIEFITDGQKLWVRTER